MSANSLDQPDIVIGPSEARAHANLSQSVFNIGRLARLLCVGVLVLAMGISDSVRAQTGPLEAGHIEAIKRWAHYKGYIPLESGDGLSPRFLAFVRHVTDQPEPNEIDWKKASGVLISMMGVDTLRNLNLLNDVGVEFRNDAIEKADVFFQNYGTTIRYGTNQDRKSLITLFFLGAVPIVMDKPFKNYAILFYNPVLDVAMLTKWNRMSDQFNLADLKIIFGEDILKEDIRELVPSWSRGTESATDSIVKRYNQIIEITKEQQKKAIYNQHEQNQYQITHDDDAITTIFARMYVASKIIIGESRCAERFRAPATKLSALLKGGVSTNIKGPIDLELVPTGGYNLESGGQIWYFAPRNWPGSLFEVTTKEQNAICDIVAVNAVSMVR